MPESIEITVEKIHETTGAIKIFDGKITVWIPKSQILREEIIPGTYEEIEAFEIEIPEWLALEKGLI